VPVQGDTLLQLRDWSLLRRIDDGEVPLLSGLDLSLVAGRWVAVLGANGSGKSSLLRYLASDEAPHAFTTAIMFQDPDEQLVGRTVEGELRLGRTGIDVSGELGQYDLEQLAGVDPRLLSAGQKQRLVLAVAEAARPEILFCDEPTALQDPEQAEWILDRLDSWRFETGGVLVSATCDRREVDRADDLLVIADGRVAAAGPRSELRQHPLVLELLGEDPPLRMTAGSAAKVVAEWGCVDSTNRLPALQLKDVGFRLTGPGGGFTGVSTELFPGQRLGLTGPNGCGKSTLLAACAGVRAPDRGTVALSGRQLFRGGPQDLDHGLALLAPQFPEYIFSRPTVAAEIALDPALSCLGTAPLLARAGLPSNLADRNPHSLSAGQKRRLALAMVAFSGRSLLLFDEPTAALDGPGRRLVLDLLQSIPADTAVIVASHDLDFLAAAGFPVAILGPRGIAGEATGGGGR